jgi:hypothetical protein
MNSDQIRPIHFTRLADLSIRQSSLQQVRNHTESQHRHSAAQLGSAAPSATGPSDARLPHRHPDQQGTNGAAAANDRH